MMVRAPVWWSSLSLSMNASVPSLHWTSVQTKLRSPLIWAMRVSLKYHLMCSCCFVWTPVFRVTGSPSVTDAKSAWTPEEDNQNKPKKTIQQCCAFFPLDIQYYESTNCLGLECNKQLEENTTDLHIDLNRTIVIALIIILKWKGQETLTTFTVIYLLNIK